MFHCVESYILTIFYSQHWAHWYLSFETARNTPVVKVRFIGLCNKGAHTSWGTVVCQEKCMRGIYRIWACIRWFEWVFKEACFALDWVLSISRNTLMIGYLNKPYLGGKTQVVIEKDTSAVLISQEWGCAWSSPFSLCPRLHPAA